MTAVAQSRFSPPSLAATIPRPRLLSRMDDYADARLTMILGQAAQGKSILAATWLRQSGVEPVWINLAAADKDPDNFYHTLIRALEPHFSEQEFSYLVGLPAVSAGFGTDPGYGRFVTPFRKRLKKRIHIVMDDLDQLPGDAPVFELLQALIDSGPLKAHWLLLSRQMPPLAIEALNVKRQMLMIDNRQLAFTQDETRSFFQEGIGWRISEGQYRRIQESCEGWIGGMVLLNQALEGLDAEERNRYLESLPDRYIAEQAGSYFEEVILTSLPFETRELIVQSAIFKEIRPEVLEALFPEKDIESIFRNLADRHLFVSSVGDQRHSAVYRFHNLLRDHLMHRFRRQYDQKRQQAHFIRAAEILENFGSMEEAMAFFLAAGEYLSAARILEEIGFELLLDGRKSDIEACLNDLPEGLIRERPWLLLLSARVHRCQERTQCFRYYENALQIFEKDGDVRGRLLALGGFIDVILLTGSAHIPLANLVEKAEALLGETETDNHPLETTLLWIHVAAAHAFRGGVGPIQIVSCQNALRMANRLRHPLLSFKAHMNFVIACAMCGMFEEGEEHVARMVEILADYPYPEMVAIQLSVEGVLRLMRGNRVRMTEVVQELNAVMAENHLFYLEIMQRTTECYHALMMEDNEEAMRTGRYLIQISDSAGDQYTKGSTHLLMGVNAYYHGRYSEAEELLKQAVTIMALPEGHSDDHLTLIKTLLGLNYIHLGEFGMAEEFLLASEAYYKRAENRFSIIDVRLARALLARAGKRDAETVQWLQTAFNALETYRYRRLVPISRRDFAFCAYLVLDLNVPDCRDTAISLLTGELADVIPPEMETLRTHGDPDIRSAALDIARSIRRADQSRLRIECLGGFKVTTEQEGAPVQWERKLPRNLLKAIVAHDGEMPVEKAMELLWPESTPEKQKSSFKVTLHRLRKILEPEMDKTIGSSYLHIRGERLVLDKALCLVDSSRFKNLCEIADKASRSGNARRAGELYREALELYKGDFLPDDLYDDWIESKRTRLGNRCIEAGLSLSGIRCDRDDFAGAKMCLEKIFSLDPLREDVCRRLMEACARMGDMECLKKAYAKLGNAIEKEIGAGPSPETVAAFNAIVSELGN